jgi:hypothetical protein
MRSHYSIGFEGLKDKTNNFPVFIRLNLIDGNKKDQLIVLMDQNLSSLVDEFDSEKMTVPGYPQLYASIGDTKLVMNALPLNKTKTLVPLTLNLPITKVYELELDEYHLENSLLILEDKQENIFQELSIHSNYSFYANNGILDDRFVLHINTPIGSITANEVSSQFKPLITQYGLSGKLLIQLKEPCPSACHLRIFDMNARLVYDASLSEAETILHFGEGKGIYYLEIDNSHMVYRKKIAIL